MLQKQNLSIGNIAARTGLAVSAIRYYGDVGLVSPERNSGGQRRYHRADIRRLSFVIIARQMGYDLAQIKNMLAGLPNNRTPTKADWTRISKNFRADIDAQISSLKAVQGRLDGCIGCGCLSLKACRLYNPDDKSGKRGSGPQLVSAAIKG